LEELIESNSNLIEFTCIIGTGKTLLARAVAHHTECTFIRVSGSELVQKFIGEGSRMVRELFVMARYTIFFSLIIYCAIISAANDLIMATGNTHLQSFSWTRSIALGLLVLNLIPEEILKYSVLC